MKSGNDISYFKIALAVCGGVLMAGAISSVVGWLVFNAVPESETESIQTQAEDPGRSGQEAAAGMREHAAPSQPEHRQATEEQRLDTETGKTLSRVCREYSEFYDNNPGPYAREQRDKACERSRIYLETGEIVD